MGKLFRCDDTDAFNQNWLTIEADYPQDWIVSMAEFKVSNLPSMFFEDPEFPLMINLSSAQTALLKDTNSCYLTLYDTEGRRQTCEGTFIFETRKKVT